MDVQKHNRDFRVIMETVDGSAELLALVDREQLTAACHEALGVELEALLTQLRDATRSLARARRMDAALLRIEGLRTEIYRQDVDQATLSGLQELLKTTEDKLCSLGEREREERITETDTIAATSQLDQQNQSSPPSPPSPRSLPSQLSQPSQPSQPPSPSLLTGEALPLPAPASAVSKRISQVEKLTATCNKRASQLYLRDAKTVSFDEIETLSTKFRSLLRAVNMLTKEDAATLRHSLVHTIATATKLLFAIARRSQHKSWALLRVYEHVRKPLKRAQFLELANLLKSESFTSIEKVIWKEMVPASLKRVVQTERAQGFLWQALTVYAMMLGCQSGCDGIQMALVCLQLYFDEAKKTQDSAKEMEMVAFIALAVFGRCVLHRAPTEVDAFILGVEKLAVDHPRKTLFTRQIDHLRSTSLSREDLDLENETQWLLNVLSSE